METKYFEVRALQFGDIVFMLSTTLTTIDCRSLRSLEGSSSE